MAKEIKELKTAAQARAQNEAMSIQINQWLENAGRMVQETRMISQGVSQGQVINLRILNDMNKGCTVVDESGNIDLRWYSLQFAATNAFVSTLQELAQTN